MAGCQINSTASPQFTDLRKHWKRSYPHIDDDLDDAFAAISKDIKAKNAWRLQAGPRVEVYKYRQNSKDIRRGASYGWRIVALFDKNNGTMYPILVWPKPVMADADDTTLSEAIADMRKILGYCTTDTCEGSLAPVDPPVVNENDGSVQVQCSACGTKVWKPA